MESINPLEKQLFPAALPAYKLQNAKLL